MITLLDISFWLYFIYFFFAVFIAFFIPGDLLIKRLNLPSFSRITVSTLLGLVIWGWQGYVLGYLGIRWASYVYLLTAFLIWIKNKHWEDVLDGLRKMSLKKIDMLILLIIIAGMFMQLSSVWLNGVLTLKGLYFCCGSSGIERRIVSITPSSTTNGTRSGSGK